MRVGKSDLINKFIGYEILVEGVLEIIVKIYRVKYFVKIGVVKYWVGNLELME